MSSSAVTCALVTGVRRGIGHAIVSRFLHDGYRVAGTVRSGTQQGASWPRPVRLEVADATDKIETTHAVESVVEAFGGLDVVVANAGRGVSGGVLAMSDDHWIDQLRNKLTSVTNLVSAALPHLRESDHPRIVVIGGITGIAPEPDQGAVSAMRAAQISLVRSLSVQLADDGICVNSVLLGAILTDRQRDKFAQSDLTDFDEWVAEEVKRRKIPFGRFGSSEEVADLVAFLSSKTAGYITGAMIPVSGGMGI